MLSRTTDNIRTVPQNRRFRADEIVRHGGARSLIDFSMAWRLIVAAWCCCLATGCHDGPLYALKHVNPYFTMREWKRDRALGVTDHERRNELIKLTEVIGDMPAKEQAFWKGHLGRILRNDPSPEMRRLAVLAAGRIKDPAAIDLIERGLEDESLKVQMACCSALGQREEPRAVQLLAQTVGATTELDVKNSAIAALGNHRGRVPLESLRVVLNEQDPATLDLAMTSLRSVMGEDHGRDPKQWIAAIDNGDAPAGDVPGGGTEGDVRYADRDGTLRR
jgi:hypothetical protein